MEKVQKKQYKLINLKGHICHPRHGEMVGPETNIRNLFVDVLFDSSRDSSSVSRVLAYNTSLDLYKCEEDTFLIDEDVKKIIDAELNNPAKAIKAGGYAQLLLSIIPVEESNQPE